MSDEEEKFGKGSGDLSQLDGFPENQDDPIPPAYSDVQKRLAEFLTDPARRQAMDVQDRMRDLIGDLQDSPTFRALQELKERNDIFGIDRFGSIERDLLGGGFPEADPYSDLYESPDFVGPIVENPSYETNEKLGKLLQKTEEHVERLEQTVSTQGEMLAALQLLSQQNEQQSAEAEERSKRANWLAFSAVVLTALAAASSIFFELRSPSITEDALNALAASQAELSEALGGLQSTPSPAGADQPVAAGPAFESVDEEVPPQLDTQGSETTEPQASQPPTPESDG